MHRIHFEFLRLKLFLEIAGTSWIYGETKRHEFFWSRTQWFEGPNGKDRHWVFERKADRRRRTA